MATNIDFEPESTIDFEPENQLDGGLSPETVLGLQRQSTLAQGGRQMGEGNDRLVTAIGQSFIPTAPTPQEIKQLELEKAAGVEPIPVGLRIASGIHSGIQKAAQWPKIVNALTVAGLDMAGLGDTDLARQNRDVLAGANAKEADIAARDRATLGDNDIINQLAEGTGRGVAELPLYLIPGMAAQTPAQALRVAAGAGGVVGGGMQLAQDLGEGRSTSEALPYAIASGLITAWTTRAFGNTGAEAIFRTEGLPGIRNRLVAVLKDAGLQGAEEAGDQIQQDFLERYTRNPEKPVDATLKEVLMAGAIGGIIGGGVGAGKEGIEAISNVAQRAAQFPGFERDTVGTALPEIDFEPEPTRAQTIQPAEIPAGRVEAKLEPETKPIQFEPTPEPKAETSKQILAELQALPGADQDLNQAGSESHKNPQQKQGVAEQSDTQSGLESQSNQPATKADLADLAAQLRDALQGNQLKPSSPEATPTTSKVSSTIQPVASTTPPAGATASPIPRLARRRIRTAGRGDGEPTLLDMVGESGGLGGPDLETAMREMTAGKSAAQVLEPYGGEYDGLANVLETIFDARRNRKNNSHANMLAKAYEAAGFGGNSKGVDQALQGLHQARDAGLGVKGGIPETEYDLIDRSWQQAQDKLNNPNELPQTVEGKAELFWEAATKPENKIGLKRVNISDLKPGDTFRLKGKGLSHAELTVRFVDSETGEVQVKDGPTFGTQDLPPGTEIYVHDLQREVKNAAGEFSFDAPESVADQKARLAREKQAEAERKAKEQMQERAQARLTSDEDTRTGDMFSQPEHRTTRQDKSGQGSLFAAGDAPIFRSNIEDALATWQNKGTPEQLRAHLAKTRGAMDEAEWIGLDEFLANKPSATKAEVADFVAKNKVDVQEVTKGDSDIGDVAAWWNDEGGANSDIPFSQLKDSDKSYAIDRYNEEVAPFSENPTKFENYQLPGGENYRELLLTLPGATMPEGYRVEQRDDGFHVLNKYGSDLGTWPSRDAAERSQARHPDSPAFRSSHFDEPNILAHVRFNERTDADGKRVLFIEEVQSDWHQQGRKEGYKKPSGDAWDAMTKGVPDAPFKQTWPMLAMKRMIRYAADNGFDRIAWTTGEQQAERYDLSKQVQKIDAWRMDDERGLYDIHVTDNTGKMHRFDNQTADKLPDLVGKEMAEKIVNDTQIADKGVHFSGLDLKVGGEGMKGFYDRILPSEVNKFVKKWGGKVGQSEIPGTDKSDYKYREFLTREEATDWAENNLGNHDYKVEPAGSMFQVYDEFTHNYAQIPGRGSQVHSLDITPAMKDAAQQGLPMFAKGAGRGLTEAQATDAIKAMLGVDSLPAGIRVVRDMEASWGARIQGRDTITVNAAQISTPERARAVILEEGLHGVWNDPAVQRAWDSVRKLVTPAELEAEFTKRKAQGLPTDAATIREEAAIARLIEADANKGTIAKLYDAIRAAFKRIFGFDLPATDLQALKDAALEFLRNRDDWQGAKGDLKPAQAFAEGENTSEMTRIQEQIAAAEQELKEAIRMTVLPPDMRGMNKADAVKARDEAHSKLRKLLAAQLKLMTSVNVDAARSPKETADLISQTVDLLNSIQDEISERNAKSQEIPADLTKLRQDLQTRLGLLKGWTDDQAEAEAQGGTLPKDSKRDSRMVELESATDPKRETLAEWWEKTKRALRYLTNPIPELPLTGERSQKSALFRRGYRLFAVENDRVQKEAAEKVQHVLEPLTKLGRDPQDNAALKLYFKLGEALQRAKMDPEKTKEIQARMTKLQPRLDADPFNLFRRLVLYRDLWWRGTYLKTEDGKPITLPMGLTVDDVRSELRRLTDAISKHKDGLAITEALRRHYKLTDDLQKSILAHGEIIPESLRNPLYFPHHMIDSWTGRIDRVRASTEEDFRRYLIAPQGSGKLIQSDYLKAMYLHTADVLAHNARVDLVDKYWKPYDIGEQLKAQHGEAWDKPWNIPAGYKLFTPYKKLPLRMDYILSRETLAQKLGVLFNDGDLRERMGEVGKVLKVTPEDLHAALVAGEKIKWALPEEIADALNGIAKREAAEANPGLGNALGKPFLKLNSFWKGTKLFAPWNWIRYEYGNLSTDAIDKVLAADPGAAKYLDRASREIWASGLLPEPPKRGDSLYGRIRSKLDAAARKVWDKPLTPEFKAAQREGVFDTVTAGEAGALLELPAFKEFLTPGEKNLATLKRILGGPARGSKFREATFRYANFLANLERLRAGKEPVYAGAFHGDIRALGEDVDGQRRILDGEELNYAKAAEISLKTFGDYNSLGVASQWLRKYAVPFWSWQDVNFRYHANQLRNLADGLMGKQGDVTDAQKAILRYAGARTLSTLIAVGIAKELWNQFGGVAMGLWDKDDDLESKLSAEDRRRGHLIVGKDAKGQPMVIYTPSAWSDVAEWVGGQNMKRLFMEYARGQITLDQVAKDYAKQLPRDVINKLFGSMGPLIKGPYEAVSGMATFPDVTDQRRIPSSERWWRLVSTLTDDRAVNALRASFDKDFYSQPATEQLQQIILQIRRRDPEQWSYYEAREDASDWKEAKTGKRHEGGAYDAPEAMALRNFRKAIYRGDVANAERFYSRLLEYGYTAERLDASIRSQHPLADLNESERNEYIKTLSVKQRQELELAMKYYNRIKALDGREKQLFPQKGSKPRPNPELLRRIVEKR